VGISEERKSACVRGWDPHTTSLIYEWRLNHDARVLWWITHLHENFQEYAVCLLLVLALIYRGEHRDFSISIKRINQDICWTSFGHTWAGAVLLILTGSVWTKDWPDISKCMSREHDSG
jgi:hypothetical protein